mmetsp:Transcript_33193/g.50072  ORF Transcript_33193/g.50072 Transcript_33193/m.50072 type:complete len:399 (-) Transcript_33193:288-1484(-)
MSIKKAEESVFIAAVEGGGTTFVVAVAQLTGGRDEVEILVRAEVDSSHDDPQRTLQECATFFQTHRPTAGYHALGLACFGPLGVKEEDEHTYGRILSSTPKAPWRNCNLLEPLRRACQGSAKRPLPVLVDTDVNAPALAEYFVAQQEETSLSSLAYITCGTGVGVGLVIHGQCVHGRMHPEGGHVPVKPLEGDEFPGYSWGTATSPFGGVHTVEGIASSVALTERLEWMMQQQQKKKNSTATATVAASKDKNDRSILITLPDDHEVWDHAANALANLCVTLFLTTSMERIVLGGGIMQRAGLMHKIRTQTRSLLNNYLELPEDLSTIICEPQYGNSVGLMGAIMLGRMAYEKDTNNNGKEETTKPSYYKTSGFYQGILVGAVVGAASMAVVVSCQRRT